MHIFGKKKDEKKELVELSAEEQKQVDDFVRDMERNLNKYQVQAEQYNARMLGQWFTLREFNRITNIPLGQCQVIINWMCDFFLLLMDEKPGGEHKFKFILKPEERLPHIKTAMQHLTMSFISKTGFLNFISKELGKQIEATPIEKPN